MTTVSSSLPTPFWSRADGIQLLGSVSGSGLVDTTYLVKRGDGQLLQISELLNLVVRELVPGRGPEEVAEAVSQEFGRRLTPQGLEQLITATLQPLGLVVDANEEAGNHAVPPRANPLLSLRFRGTMLSERLVNVVAGWLRPFFYPPVVVVALIALVVMDVVLVLHGSFVDAVDQVLDVPVLLLALILLLVLGGLIHELGHATACRYGGGRPGVIGFGMYIVFPAFFTNVTDSYRLNRAGRLRTDLGGLYFNVWCLLAGRVRLSPHRPRHLPARRRAHADRDGPAAAAHRPVRRLLRPGGPGRYTRPVRPRETRPGEPAPAASRASVGGRDEAGVTMDRDHLGGDHRTDPAPCLRLGPGQPAPDPRQDVRGHSEPCRPRRGSPGRWFTRRLHPRGTGHGAAQHSPARTGSAVPTTGRHAGRRPLARRFARRRNRTAPDRAGRPRRRRDDPRTGGLAPPCSCSTPTTTAPKSPANPGSRSSTR